MSSSSDTTWGKTWRYSKRGFDKAWHTVDKLGAPVNRLSYKIGSEAFWPMSLDKESDKAARILRSFCKDGFYTADDADAERVDAEGRISRPKGKQKVLKKIPSQVIQRAKGLAIFTTMRTGLWFSGSGGAGILVGRIPNTGEWSPPSGIMLHTAGVGVLAGIDIYDCVVVINTHEALEAFKKMRCTLGGEVSVAAGPVGMGGVLESEVHKRQAPIWTYMKTRGLYGGIQVDGTILIERTDENERFFGERLSVTDILGGMVKHPPPSIKPLMETIKAAEGSKDVDEAALPPPGESPADLEIRPDVASFGVPAMDDPDPYGVKALEAEGLFIREAGTMSRPTRDAFEFRPQSGSPIFANFPRRSPASSTRNSLRASVQSHTSASHASIDRAMQTDSGTQTDDVPTAPTSISRTSSRSEVHRADSLPVDGDPYHVEHYRREYEDDGEPSPRRVKHYRAEQEAVDEEADSMRVEQRESVYGGNACNDENFDDDNLKIHEISSATVSKRGSAAGGQEHNLTGDNDNLEVHEVGSATVSKRSSAASSPSEDQTSRPDSKRLSPTFAKPKLVTIPKRPAPPPLPPRNPQRHPAASSQASPAISPSTSPTGRRSVASINSQSIEGALTDVPLNNDRPATEDVKQGADVDAGRSSHAESAGRGDAASEDDIHSPSDNRPSEAEEQKETLESTHPGVTPLEVDITHDEPLEQPSDTSGAQSPEAGKHHLEHREEHHEEHTEQPLVDMSPSPKVEESEQGTTTQLPGAFDTQAPELEKHEEHTESPSHTPAHLESRKEDTESPEPLAQSPKEDDTEHTARLPGAFNAQSP